MRSKERRSDEALRVPAEIVRSDVMNTTSFAHRCCCRFLVVGKKYRQPNPIPQPQPTTVDLTGLDLEAYLKSPSPLPRLSGPTLTEQQLRIISVAAPPNLSKGCVVRVTAAAGTGKTTTLQKAVTHLVGLGHDKVVYVTFNKNAAEDATKRFYADISPPSAIEVRACEERGAKRR